MLASPGASLGEAMEKVGAAAVDWKLDGARIQVHRDGDDVAVFSRSLDDLTSRLPEVVAATLALDARSAVLDGEAIALRADGRPEPFQVTGSRIASGAPGVVPVLSSTPCTSTARTCSTRRWPGGSRRSLPPSPRPLRVPARDHRRPGAGRRPHFDAALAAGHEGVVVKALDAPYAAGRRGAAG